MAWPELEYSKHCSLHRMAWATNLGMQGWGSDWVPYTERGAYGDDIDKILATPDVCRPGRYGTCSTARMIHEKVRNKLSQRGPIAEGDCTASPDLVDSTATDESAAPT